MKMVFFFILVFSLIAAQIKTDVETQGDFIRSLIKEVEEAAFTDIEDVVPFVKWLDDELSYLVIIRSRARWCQCSAFCLSRRRAEIIDGALS